MANSEHLKILSQGAKAWNTWRERNPEKIPDFSGAYIGGMGLADSCNDGSIKISYEFEEDEVDLTRLNLSRANMKGCDFELLDLTEANLSYLAKWEGWILVH